jgi:hypothetical protein
MRIEQGIIVCRTCGKQYPIKIQQNKNCTVDYMGCNWCPECEYKAREDYREWYVYKSRKKVVDIKPLSMF